MTQILVFQGRARSGSAWTELPNGEKNVEIGCGEIQQFSLRTLNASTNAGDGDVHGGELGTASMGVFGTERAQLSMFCA